MKVVKEKRSDPQGSIQISVKHLKWRFQRQPLYVFCKKRVLQHFVKLTGKYLFQSLFLNKVVSVSVKRHFLWILQNFQEHLFYRTYLNKICSIHVQLCLIMCDLLVFTIGTKWYVCHEYQSMIPVVPSILTLSRTY